MATDERVAGIIARLVDIWQIDPEMGRRALHVIQDYAELTPEERRRVQAIAPHPDICEAERAIAQVWRPTL